MLGSNDKGMLEVEYIDFGNTVTVKKDHELRKLPAHLLAYEPQALSCQFAYIRAPKLNSTQGKDAAKYVEKFCLNKIVDAIFVE